MTYMDEFDALKKYYNTGATLSYAFRKEALLKLKAAIIQKESEIEEALFQDLGKSKEESYLTEIGVILSEISYTLKHLKSWMKREKRHTPLMLFKATSYLYKEPYGVVLILAPWNYPFQLSFSPLIGAIASGNVSAIKPSEHASATALVIHEIIHQVFESNYVKVVLGDALVAESLLTHKWDYIFYTGSTNIGKKVMQAASKELIPVTLELGGKSPAIITENADIKMAVKRIVYGKYINAGQTCIAPDYIMIPSALKDAFVTHFKAFIDSFYPNPLNNDIYPKIINVNHHKRLVSYLNDGVILSGGAYNETKIEPTLLLVADLTKPVMQDEIFGPILPICFYEDLDTLITTLKDQPKPLAFYPFTNDKQEQKKLIESLSFGGATINDTIMHFVNPEFGFGGVGYSGMGSYHGKQSFLTFTHLKPVLKRSVIIDLPMRYFPISKLSYKLLRKFLR